MFKMTSDEVSAYTPVIKRVSKKLGKTFFRSTLVKPKMQMCNGLAGCHVSEGDLATWLRTLKYIKMQGMRSLPSLPASPRGSAGHPKIWGHDLGTSRLPPTSLGECRGQCAAYWTQGSLHHGYGTVACLSRRAVLARYRSGKCSLAMAASPIPTTPSARENAPGEEREANGNQFCTLETVCHTKEVALLS